MRKIAAILLMLLLAFHWYGYRVVTNYLQHKADRQLEGRLDVNDYDESQLIEIKVALDMPYQNNQSGFERHYGEIEINGQVYSYVKRKIEDGYLVLKCIPNTAKQNLKTADNILFKVNNGLDQDNNTGKNNSPLNNVSKSVFTDYDDYSLRINLKSFSASQRDYLLSGACFFNSISLPVSEQPPEHLC